MNPPSLPTLLYRYFFFGWLFRELPPNATPFERGLVLHHNRRQAVWLPKYIMRWLWCGLLLYGLAGMAELGFGSIAPVQLAYAASAACMSIAIMIATAWVGLMHRPDRA
ncbi:MAG: hypothetical protein HY854_12010 [Burkholderiales bacterium]|nr:hypothetical protein [Burkholderiales bacterium]